jgi:MYXO-CTERM domain-containing protein
MSPGRGRPSFALLALLLALPLPASAQPTATPFWRSGFEAGFPGEWLDYDNGAFAATGVPNGGFNEAWTIVDRTQFPDVFAGDHAYKGWLLAAQADSHRAYPCIHTDVPSPLVNSFVVWLDIDYGLLTAPEWVHFATWGNNPDWAVHTMSVRDRKLEMAHLTWSYIGPTPQPDFPLRRWVRFTAYLDYAGASGYVRVWQDGVAMLEGTYTSVAGTSLMRAHWGMYSSGSITQGVQYNDEIQLWTLDGPWTDLDVEPPSPYSTTPSDGGTLADGPPATDGSTPADAATPADAPGGTDAGAPGDTGGTDTAKGGCGCRTAPPERGGTLLLAAVPLSALLRRRRHCDTV